MKIAKDWKDYTVIATGNGEKLERWGNVTLLRPEPQAIWKSEDLRKQKDIDGIYSRASSGGGKWNFVNKVPDEWVIDYKDLKFKIKPMGFKHTGLFPEQAINWDIMRGLIENAGREISVLNLFGYTGGATVACLKAGASVCHVDASKGMVERCGENVRLCGLQDRPVRYIIDDCFKFVKREARRGKKYDAIIMDPPSYGRGPNGEMWRLEEGLFDIVNECKDILTDNPLFFLINSYTTGLQPAVLSNILTSTLGKTFKGEIDAYEVCIQTEEKGMVLPCGASGMFIGKE